MIYGCTLIIQYATVAYSNAVVLPTTSTVSQVATLTILNATVSFIMFKKTLLYVTVAIKTSFSINTSF